MASLQGMTGFARTSGDNDWGAWTWEVRSVNGKGLDVRVQTPPGFDELGRKARSDVGKRFSRGSVQLSLRIDATAPEGANAVNTDLLNRLVGVFEKRVGRSAEGNELATLMNVRGVVEEARADLRDLAGDDAVTAVLTTGLADALAKLLEARLSEGASLTGIMSNILDQIAEQLELAEQYASAQPGLLKKRLDDRLEELLVDKELDQERLSIEAALQAAKADVREELDRLAAHIDSGRKLLASGSPCGRKLDFLAQEFNREANTLCSKSANLDLTNVGLALKSLIDQFKEQAANVE